MANDKKKLPMIVGGAVGAGAALGAASAVRKRGEERQTQKQRATRGAEVRAQAAAAEEKQRRRAKSPEKRAKLEQKPRRTTGVAKDPTGGMTAQQSKEYGKLAKKKRLARRAAKARARGLGAAGVAAGLPSAVQAARSAEAEGGPFAARFGKFVERILGATSSQYLPRPPTEREREAARWL